MAPLSFRLAVVLWAGGTLAQAQTRPPIRIDQVPVYPGATRDRAAEQTDEVERLYMVGEWERAYVVAAPIEEVVRFYRQRLAAQEMRSDADLERAERAREQLPPGGVSPVSLEIQLRDFNDLEGFGNVWPPVTAERVRQAFTQKRPPYRPGEWLRHANFIWVHRTEDGAQEMHIGIQDWNPEKIVAEGYRPETFVRISRGPTAAETATYERLSSEAQREEESRKPPRVDSPGVAIYPGARFDPEMSAQLSSGGEASYFVYTTADDVAKVLSFYERQTGKKAVMHGEGGSMIVLRGTAPWPDLGVVIEPNRGAYPTGVKTIITVRKVEQ